MKNFSFSLFCFLFLGIGVSNGQFVKLNDFQAENDLVNVGRSQPAYDGTWLYDISQNGGVNGLGCIFKVKPDGTGFTKLLDFAGTANGANPSGSLVISGSIMYGMTIGGGVNSLGTIYKISTDGTGYTKLLDFAGTTNGSNPAGSSLTLSGSILYGMTFRGGANEMGTIFKISTDGTGYTKLLDFDNTNGGLPYSTLTLSGSILYGMTLIGGANSCGTIFKINTDGTDFTKLHDFTGINGNSPNGSLTLSGSVLFGTTTSGGSNGRGVLFKINTDGSAFTKIIDYNKAPNGCSPYNSLTVSGSIIYGMTNAGGSNGLGTIFKVNSDGTGYTKLIDFDGVANGRNPEGSLTLSGSVLYGMTTYGGANNNGTIFKINTDGTDYTKLLDFAGTTNGRHPSGSLTLSGSDLYGMTYGGGANNVGTIFKISTDGTGYTKLMDFDGATSSCSPYGSLTLSGSILYGMTSGNIVWGYGNGTIFKINTDGTGYTKLLNFSGTTNGSEPRGTLTLSGSDLYGMTNGGGANSLGTIFKISTDGTGYAKLFDFAGITNGSDPRGSLTLYGSDLYGMTTYGGANNYGAIFKIGTDGNGYAKLFDFDGMVSGKYASYYSGLTLDANILYGMTKEGGVTQTGVIFKYELPITGGPMVTTSSASNITNNSAILGGNVTDQGSTPVTARGVCWGANPSPTIANNKTSDGNGIGAFISSLNGLVASATYHARAYATNSAGTVYGEDISFTTISTGIDTKEYQTSDNLDQNYPNPFDQSTTIDFRLGKPSKVNITVYNALGQVVEVIADEYLSAGSHSKTWSPKGIAAGIYFYQLKADGIKETKRLVKK